MTTSLRWGILGTAQINRRLIPAMRTARRSELLAVASRNPERASAYAREWDIATAHGSYEALLRDHTVDAIYIPLPNSLHVEWTLRAIDAGKHVLCEKPLALTADDVDRVAAVAGARTRVVSEAFMYRHEPLTAAVMELLHDDAIGDVSTINAGFTFLQSRSADVRLDPALGGGSLWDIGCYAVNVSRLVANAEPLRVFGIASSTDGRPFERTEGVDEAFTGLLQFPGDIVATVHCSFRAAYRTWLEVTGADGVLRVENPFRPAATAEIELRRGEDVRRVRVDGSAALFVRQIDDFVAAALDGKTPALSLVESRGNAATLAALYASARSGMPVTL